MSCALVTGCGGSKTPAAESEAATEAPAEEQESTDAPTEEQTSDEADAQEETEEKTAAAVMYHKIILNIFTSIKIIMIILFSISTFFYS